MYVIALGWRGECCRSGVPVEYGDGEVGRDVGEEVWKMRFNLSLELEEALEVVEDVEVLLDLEVMELRGEGVAIDDGLLFSEFDLMERGVLNLQSAHISCKENSSWKRCIAKSISR